MIIDYDQIAKLVESNLEVRVREESVKSSKVRISSVASTFIPEVSLYAQGEDSELKKVHESPTAGVFANLNLFNGFRDVEKNKINNLSYETNKLEFKKSYNEDVFRAKKYYLEALRILEDIKILAEHEKINKNNRELILKKVASGLSPKSEELIFKKIELSLKEQRVKEDNALKIVYSNLRTIFSLDRNEQIEVVGDLDISKFNYRVPTKKIDLAIVESNESLLNAEKKVSGLWRMPRVNLYAEKSFTNHVNGEFLDEGDEEQVIGLRVTLPIFSEKNVDSIEDQTKKIEYQAAVLKKKSQIRELESADEKIEIQLDHLKSMIEISKGKVELSKEIMEKTFSEFRLGLKEALSLNEATADYLEARKDLIEHKVEYILSVEESKVNSID
ncbi:TolC family protein [Bacteriovorax sp. PP10]|uniref:TolC family protein n=1 Tax=Bacteriovorax antarcticus TaxID=3088717 RepID=A0ABU5W0Y1_9BACT|nr:TolC family protein [Bacteriovorax sp. PP10]MEA9358472.1 TolC family protein [Bacteriovorax sp. PP10]